MNEGNKQQAKDNGKLGKRWLESLSASCDDGLGHGLGDL